MSKVSYIEFLSNDSLPQSVKDCLPDENTTSLFRAALNSHLRDGKNEPLAYLKAYRFLEDAGYERKEGKFVYKELPTAGDVHVDAPLGTGNGKKKKPVQLDDPGTQDVSVDNVEKIIRQESGQWHVYSHDGSKHLGGPYGTKAEAVERLRQVEGHKEKCGEIQKRISGSSDISLNAEGRNLADELGKRIALKGGLDIGYSSPLPRASETLDAIAKRNPQMKRAEPNPDLQPWHLGELEGQEGGEVRHRINYFVEHPNERPKGKGADGKPAETFNEARDRQLNFWTAVLNDAKEHPNLKIAVVAHSRGVELLQSWLDAGMPEDFDLDTKDLLKPDDPAHASILRLSPGKDKLKEVDLDKDDELKPGLYVILHSLTDDDGDKGNKDLEKAEVIELPHPPNLRAAEHESAERCNGCGYFETGLCRMFAGFPVRPDQICDEFVAAAPGSLGEPVHKAAAPVEVQQAARAALGAGTVIPEITEALSAEGLTEYGVRKLAAHFAADQADSDHERNAWGGPMAAKWAARVLKKLERDREPWIGVDLDGTLAHKLDSYGEDGTAIGEPVPAMVDRVKQWLGEGKQVKIFTARVANDPERKIEHAIRGWCREHLGKELPVTCEKDPRMTGLWDDRAHGVVADTGVEKRAREILLAKAQLTSPLLLRLLEFVRENQMDDIALHQMAEHIEGFGRELGIEDYEQIVAGIEAEPVEKAGEEQPLGKMGDGIATLELIDLRLAGNITKLDEDRRLAFGWASIVEINGKPVIDSQGDQIAPDTIELAAYDYVLKERSGGEMHERDDENAPIVRGELVESIVFTVEKQMAIQQSLIDQGIAAVIVLGCVGWWVGFRYSDESTWLRIKNGERREFSIGGKGKRVKAV